VIRLGLRNPRKKKILWFLFKPGAHHPLIAYGPALEWYSTSKKERKTERTVILYTSTLDSNDDDDEKT